MRTLDYYSPGKTGNRDPLSIETTGVLPALCALGMGVGSFVLACNESPFWRNGEIDVAMLCVMASICCALTGWLCVLQTKMRPRGSVASSLALAAMFISSTAAIAVLLF